MSGASKSERLKRIRRRQRALLRSLPDGAFPRDFPLPARDLFDGRPAADRAAAEREVRALADQDRKSLTGIDELKDATRDARAARLVLDEIEKMYPPQPTPPPDEDPFADLRAHLAVRANAAPSPPLNDPAFTRLVALLVLADAIAGDGREDPRIATASGRCSWVIRRVEPTDRRSSARRGRSRRRGRGRGPRRRSFRYGRAGVGQAPWGAGWASSAAS